MMEEATSQRYQAHQEDRENDIVALKALKAARAEARNAGQK
jgi:hypothetical protein